MTTPMRARMTARMTHLALAAFLALAATAAVGTAERQDPQRGGGAGSTSKVSPGNGTLIIGAYPKQFWIIDEASQKVVGSIPYTSGIPRRTALSHDRKRFYTVEA